MKMPYLTDKQIELRADIVREKAYNKGVDKDFPFDAESTIEFLFEYQLRLGEDMQKGILGYTSWQERVVAISSNSYNDGSHRFTVAHEVGHLELHIDLLQENEKLTPLFDMPTSPHQDEVAEMQANKFASALLMPRSEMLKLRDEIIKKGSIIQPQDVAQKFGVSKEAARIRLEQLKMVQDKGQDGLIAFE